MKAIGKLALLGVLGGLGAGCSEDSTGTELPNIVGTWHATSAVVTNVASPTTTVNLVTLGATIQVVFNANLTYSSTVNIPGEAAEVSTGTYVVTATQLTLHDDQPSGGDTVVFSLALGGGTLTLTGGSPFSFDFGAGEVAATLALTLVH